MKNVNGAVAHKSGILKSIVLVMLVFITTITVGCRDSSQKAVTDIGGARGQEIRKESVQSSITTDIGGKSSSTLQYSGVTTPAEIGGSKTIKGEFIAITDIGGKSIGTIQFSELATTTDIGGGKSIKGEFSIVTDIGGGKNTNGTLQISKSATVQDIGGKSTNVGRIFLAFTDIGGRKDTSTGNVVAALESDIGGGRDVVIIKLTSETVAFDIGDGGKASTTTLIV